MGELPETVYTRLAVNVSAVLTDALVVPSMQAFNSIYIAQIPAGVTLDIQLGNKGYIPNVQNRQSFDWGPCVEEREGLKINTTGTSVTPLILILGTAPSTMTVS